MSQNQQDAYPDEGSEQGQLDIENVVLRRSDPDDCDQIINLVEIGKDDIYNRVYSFPKILKLIETSYLSITVFDTENNVLAFADFEDHPQGLKGTYDDVHYNMWEGWFQEAFEVSEFNPSNCLWLTYFITGKEIPIDEHETVFKKIMQTVYTSLPDIISILFLSRGDADEDDRNYCFKPISDSFELIDCKN